MLRKAFGIFFFPVRMNLGSELRKRFSLHYKSTCLLCVYGLIMGSLPIFSIIFFLDFCGSGLVKAELIQC